jgi:hypothetical protein
VLVARVVGDDAELGGERMRAGRHQPPEGGGGLGEVASRRRERGDRRGHAGARRRHDLQLGRRQLELEARVAAAALVHLASAREQVERLGVEQEELLLDPDSEGGRRVEDGAQLGGGGLGHGGGLPVRVAQPPWPGRRRLHRHHV